MTEKKEHKKGKFLKYNNLKLQNYLKSDKFTTTEAKFLFKIRSNMLNVKSNFKQKYKNNDLQSEEDSIKCELCKKHADDQESLLSCEALNITESINYANLFSENCTIAVEATRVYRKIWLRREELQK